MGKCPKYNAQIPNRIVLEAMDAQTAEHLAGYRERICGWEGYVENKPSGTTNDSKTKKISRRNISALKFENSFLSRCDKKGWIIEKSNLFATYLLSPNQLRNRLARKKSKLLYRAISAAGLDDQLECLFDDNLCEQNEFYPDDAFKIYGLPDFIILTPYDELPIWVEVKYGTSKLSPIQKKMKRKLELMGFRYYIFRGGSISAFERQLKSH